MPDLPVSVIVPVFNGEAYLAEALESIARQGYAPLDVIVVDDGSTDGTARIAQARSGVRYWSQENRGAAAARNAGLRLAQGEAIAFLDADDLWADDKLRVQAALLADDSRTGIVLGQTQLIQPGGEGQSGWSPLGRPGLVMSLASALFRRSVFDRVGVFDEGLRFSEDTDWFLRAREAGIPFVVHPQTVLFYRRHGRNVTEDRDTAGKMFVTALKRSLDRRRKQPPGAPAPSKDRP